MKINRIFLAAVGFALVMFLSWCAGPGANNQEKNVKPAEPTPGMSAPVGWSLKHAIYAVNTAIEGADTTVLDRVLFDKQTRVISFNQNKTYITNLAKVAADLPNVSPEGTFEGKPMECEYASELSSSFYEGYYCRFGSSTK